MKVGGAFQHPFFFQNTELDAGTQVCFVLSRVWAKKDILDGLLTTDIIYLAVLSTMGPPIPRAGTITKAGIEIAGKNSWDRNRWLAICHKEGIIKDAQRPEIMQFRVAGCLIGRKYTCPWF